MKVPKIRIWILLLITLHLFSCRQGVSEEEEYQIISLILNHSYSHETDDENGLGWVDLSKKYNSLLVVKHTRLIVSDIEIIEDYINFVNFSEFPISDFQKYREWEVNKIKGYDRYRLETDTSQNTDSIYIGRIQISSISFNQDMNEALVYSSYSCGGDCGEGLVFHLKKNHNWEIESVQTMWVS